MNSPAFDPATIGQECPNGNRRLGRRLEENVQRLGHQLLYRGVLLDRQGLYLPRYRRVEVAAYIMTATSTTGRPGRCWSQRFSDSGRLGDFGRKQP